MYWFLKILSSIPLYGQKNGIAHCQATPSQKQMEISPRAHQQKMFFLAPFLEVTVGQAPAVSIFYFFANCSTRHAELVRLPTVVLIPTRS